MKYTKPILGISFVAMAGALGSVPALAQGGGADEAATGPVIVVTAQRREEAQVDVPITVTTLSAETLQNASVTELTDIDKVTPALRFDRQTQFVQPTIRGIGTSVTNSGSGSNVGIYIDGFYSPNPIAADFQLMKIEAVQVLKGPQGTLFGRNTTGGAILVDTADPSLDPAGAVKFSYGRFDEIRAQAYATGGLTDGIAIDIEGLYTRSDGRRTDIISGEKVAGFDSWSVRTGLKFNLGENISVKLRYQHAETDDDRGIQTNAYFHPSFGSGAPFFAPPGTFTSDPELVARDLPIYFVADTDIVQATVEVDLGFADLTSYSQYRTEDTDSIIDLDQSGLQIFPFGLPVDNATYTQEFLLTSKPGTRLQWTAGLFYFENSDTYRTFLELGPLGGGRTALGGSGTTTRSYAAFADFTYEITPQLFLTAGGRFAHDQIDNAYYILPFSGTRTYVTQAQSDAVEGNKFTPRVVLRYKPTEDSSVYASYSQGYKAGILDVGGSTGNPVQPEKVHAFEAGYKLDNRTFGFEVAGFYYDYTNLQVSLFKGNPPSAQLVNAASSEIYGVEGQFRWNPSEAFSIMGGAAYVHARYKEFVDAPIYTPCASLDAATQAVCAGGGISFLVLPGTTLRNVTMQRTPKFTANIGANYSVPVAGGTLDMSGNLYYTSKFFFGPSGIQFPGGDYEVLSLRAQWTDPSDSWHIAVFGDNLTDNRYVTQAQYNNFGIGATYSDPVTWGIEFGASF